MDSGCLAFRKDIRWWNRDIGWRKSWNEGRANKLSYTSDFKSRIYSPVYRFMHSNSPTSSSVALERPLTLQLYAPSKSWLISNTIRSFWGFWKVLVSMFSCSLSGKPGLRTQNWPLSPILFSRHWRVILFCDRPMYTTVTDCAVTSVGTWETATISREKIQNATMLFFNWQQRESS